MPGKGRRLRRLTMRNHLCKPEVSTGGCNGERRRALMLCACFIRAPVQIWQLAL